MPEEPILAVENLDSLDRIERSKRVQAQYIPPVRFDTPDYSTSFKLDKLNETTIKTAPKREAAASISSRPELIEIKEARKTRALGIDIAEAIKKNEETLQGIVRILVNNINFHNEAIVKLNKEDQAELKALIKQLSNNENLNTVKSLLNVVTSATAITIGAVLLAPETVAAVTATAAGAALYASVSSVWSYLLIATGVSNILTNEILPRIGGYEKVASFFTSSEADRKKLAENIQITTSFTNTIMGVVSSIAASPLIGAALDWSHGLKLLNTTLELSTGAANFASDLSEHQFNKLQSNQTLSDGKLAKEQSVLDNEFMKLHSATDLEQSFNKIIYNIFETLNRILENTTK